MAQYADNFNRSGTFAGSATSSGAQPWRVVSGTWSLNGTYATRSGASGIAVLDTTSLDCASTIDAYGGTALYARVKDANNWIRARINYYSTSYSYPYTVTTTTYYFLADMTSGGGSISNQSCSTTNPNGCTTAPEYGYSSTYSVTNRRENGASSSQRTEYATGYNYYWQAVLEQAVNGTVTTLATGTAFSSRQTTLGLRVQGTSARLTHGTDTLNATVPAESAAAAKSHGIGYGTTTSDQNRYDNFTIDTLNTPPTPATPSAPVTGSVVARQDTIRLGWTYADPDAGDKQSRYVLRYHLQGVTDWTSVTENTPNTYRDFAPGTLAVGDYEWQVLTTDSAGLDATAYSTSAFFRVANAPAAPTITEPTGGTSVPQEHLLRWSAPAQQAYEVRTVGDAGGTPNLSVVYIDSGFIDSDTTRERLVLHPVNGRAEHTQVRVRDQGLWSPWSSVFTPVSFTPPGNPGVSLVVREDIGALEVVIVNPAPSGSQPALAANEILIDDGLGEGMVRRATGLAPNTTWTYYLPRHGWDYERNVQVVAVGANGTSTTVLAPSRVTTATAVVGTAVVGQSPIS